ncbi:MAG: glycosyltransferase family 2 protein [Verrucomicrobiota bacterium]|nr:glycosyltransferase family 2 protein [Verrucomicrobiota bacterium]
MSMFAPERPPQAAAPAPLISVVVVNYNCRRWLDRFFPSLRQQTIFERVEVVLVDNASRDGSAEICEKQMAAWRNGVFLQTGGNYGFGGGSNRGAKIARGRCLLFLNPDVWLEKNCLEELWSRTETDAAHAACPLVLDYDSDAVQTVGSSGFDLFGSVIPSKPAEQLSRIFSVGTFFFIRRDLFEKLGGFDEELFLYNEEMDLSWRAWMAGEPVTLIRSARIHHQAASAGDRLVENRTSDAKRFYANRSQLLTLLKNAQGPLLLLVFTQTALIALEAVVGAVLARRLAFVRWALFKPVADCWRLRHHVLQQRRHNRTFRRHGDWWILRRFFCFGFGRWADAKRLFKLGLKIDPAPPGASAK